MSGKTAAIYWDVMKSTEEDFGGYEEPAAIF
jgi:hypothetical protein